MADKKAGAGFYGKEKRGRVSNSPNGIKEKKEALRYVSTFEGEEKD